MEIFNRAELLLGKEGMERLKEARVIIFGIGGVGSWCAEALIRTGLGHLTIVDFDRVSESNINRQLMATTLTVGEVKVEAMRRHLLEINPDADIVPIESLYCEENADKFHLEQYDVIIDCIDSLKDKALLIEHATSTRRKFFSSMGAALKLDPTRIEVAEFYKVNGCPLARALRQRFKRLGLKPHRKFQCVFSPERLPNKGSDDNQLKKESIEQSEEGLRKSPNGSLMHITAIFGLTLAGLAIEALTSTR